jgi:hypothetical protein
VNQQSKLNRADDRLDKIVMEIVDDEAISPYRKLEWLRGQIARAEQDVLTIRADHNI